MVSPFVAGHPPLAHGSARADDRVYLGIGSGDGLNPARVTPFARKGFLQLNRGPIAPAFAPGFNCKIRDFVAKPFCI
jgi:hypothetical protein